MDIQFGGHDLIEHPIDTKSYAEFSAVRFYMDITGLIIDRLKALGRLNDYEKISSPKDWSFDRSGGPRKTERAANDYFR